MTTRPRIQRDNFPTCATCGRTCRIGDQFPTDDGSTLCADCHRAAGTARLYVSDQGEIVCRDHAGAYLQGGIDAAPNRTHYRTPLGTWEAMPAADVRAMGLDCESCAANRAPGHDFARIVGDYLDAARDADASA